MISLPLLIASLSLAAAADALSPPMRGAVLEQMEQGIGRAPIGAWATYRIEDETGLRVAFVRWAVVGAEVDPLGRPARWVELEVGPHAELRAPLAQTRFLIATRSEGKPLVTRVYAGVGAEKVREVSLEAMPAFERQPRAKAPRSTHRDLSIREGRPAKLNTVAGTLDATPTEVRYRESVVQRIWTSPQVPFLGLARIEVPASGQHLEVHAFGLDAKPRIVLPAPSEPKIGPKEAPSPGVSP